MFFVQSRIGMNDVYVGLFIVAAYTLFAAIWTGWWRGRAAFWLAMPAIGVLLGLALASKWVAAYAIGALGSCSSSSAARSGRVARDLGLIGDHGRARLHRDQRPRGPDGFGNLTFMLIMIGADPDRRSSWRSIHPIAWTDDEMRFAVGAPVAVGGARLLRARCATGPASTRRCALGSLAITPLLLGLAARARARLVVLVLYWLGGRLGFGPLAAPPGAGRSGPAASSRPRRRPRAGCGPGWALGCRSSVVAVCLVVDPVGVYVISYLPWALIGTTRSSPAGRPGHTARRCWS